jgi:hypothetical protein
MKPGLYILSVSRIAALYAIFLTPGAMAASNAQSVVNYSYAAIFGTGSYRVRDQTAFIVRLPLTHTIRQPSPTQPGITLLLPVLAGFYDYDLDEVFKAGGPGDAATASFVPGLELEYVLDDRWRLKPYGQVGMGRDLENRENSLIYLGGAKSHYALAQSGKWKLAIGNSATFAGYDPDDGEHQSLGILGMGLDLRYAWPVLPARGNTLLATSLTYYRYLDNPSFAQGDDRSKSVNGEVEWSLALAFKEPREFLGIEFERIGLGFRYGTNIKGVRLVTEFPF